MPIREMPQSNKQHAVPQNIMDVEFKLIGDLTMRQFTYLAVFCGAGYVIYTINLPPFFKWPIIILILLLGVAFAFLPYEERGLDEWIVNFFRAVYAEQQYIWRKNPSPPSAFVYQSLSIVKQELITLAPTASRRKLENFLDYQYQQKAVLDPYEKMEAFYIQKVKDAFSDYTPTNTTAVALDEEFTELNPQNIGIPDINIGATNQEPEVLNPTTSTAEVSSTQTTTQGIASPVTGTTPNSYTTPKVPLINRARESIKSTIKPVLKKITRPKPLTLPGGNNEIALRPVTPDMHAGRKLTNLSPFQGNITLPIRGERTIKTTEEIDSENDVVKKAEQLKSYIQQLKQAEKSAPAAKENTINNERAVEDLQVSKVAEELIGKFENEKTDLLAKIELLKTKIQELEKSATQMDKEQNTILLTDLEAKEAQVENTISTLRSQVAAIKTKSTIKAEPEIQETKIDIIPDYLQPQISNTIAGVIRNIRGRGLPNVLIVIKNAKNEPVRAVKTNTLGEFSLSNPLPTGNYKIEIDVNNSTGFSFDIINFEAKDAIIPAMVFVGK